jgi:hypothetical protein
MKTCLTLLFAVGGTVSGTISLCAQKPVCGTLYSLLHMAKYARKQLTWRNWYLFWVHRHMMTFTECKVLCDSNYVVHFLIVCGGNLCERPYLHGMHLVTATCAIDLLMWR